MYAAVVVALHEAVAVDPAHAVYWLVLAGDDAVHRELLRNVKYQDLASLATDSNEFVERTAAVHPQNILFLVVACISMVVPVHF